MKGVREVPTSDVLVEGAIRDISEALSSLMWMNKVFGRAYRLVRYDADGDKTVYPAAYNGNGDYITLEPSDDYGNFAWFDIYDPQEIDMQENNTTGVVYDMALVCWYNQKSVGFDEYEIKTELIKAELIELLTKNGLFRTVRAKVELERIYEDPVNVYKSYSMEKIYNRFDYAGTEEQDKFSFMYPYACIRIDFRLKIRHGLCR